MILGILQAGHVPDEMRARDGTYTDLYGNMLGKGRYTLRTFSVVDMEFPAGPQDADAWLVTGSRHGAYEDHDFIAPLEDLIRAIRDAGKPLVGVCFGHQIIAQALGGTVEKFDGGWSIGRQSYRVGDVDLHLNAWHQDQVVAPPEGAVIHASSPFCRNAIMAIGDRILTVQPHPEFEDSAIETLIDTRSATVPAPLVDAARTGLGQGTDNAIIADWIADVLEGAPATALPARFMGAAA